MKASALGWVSTDHKKVEGNREMKIRNFRKMFATVAMVFGFAMVAGLLVKPVWANVSLKNGNFFVAYTDIYYPGGFEPKIERVYNSKTPFKGMFGWGWGNEYEVYLQVAADGSVVVHEYGGGAENRFMPVAFKKEELDKAVEKIAEAAKAAGFLPSSAKEVADYRAKLATNADFRNDEWEKLREMKKVEARVLPEGAVLTSNRFSYQYITRVKNGYQRTFDSGKTEIFNMQGKLAKLIDKNNNSIDFAYGNDGKLQKLTDNFNRKIFVYFGTNGLVSKIEGENGQKSTYSYSASDELTGTTDAVNNKFGFKYTSDNRHNVAEIMYYSTPEKDATGKLLKEQKYAGSQKIDYYPIDKNENVSRVTDRDGTITEYKYEKNPTDKDHLIISIAIKGKDGKPLSSSKYEYVTKFKSGGEEWTYKMVAEIDGDRTETTYNECCGLPIIIRRGTEETTFAYDPKGHVTKKTTPYDVTDLAYDLRFGKVAKVTRLSKANPKDISWSEFKYDDKSNLTFAKNSENKGVYLFYDNSGRISTLVDQDKRKINFKYNENSKPVEISDPALGTITVSYTNSGEIKKVDSTAGRKVAFQVTTAFQNLLDIIRPAGVSLSF